MRNLLGVTALLFAASLPAQYHGGYGGHHSRYSLNPALRYIPGGFSPKTLQWAAMTSPTSRRGAVLFAERAWNPAPRPQPRMYFTEVTITSPRTRGAKPSVRIPGAIWVAGIGSRPSKKPPTGVAAATIRRLDGSRPPASVAKTGASKAQRPLPVPAKAKPKIPTTPAVPTKTVARRAST